MILGVLTGLVIVIIICLYFYYRPDANRVLDFIRKNPTKASILLIRNDDIIAQKNIDKLMPLASTVKIIIAIEYAEQCSNATLDPDELVSFAELDRFYIPKTDGDAHPNWIKSLGGQTTSDQVSIREIAKGMIRFSSNANTEWLLNRLGREHVNERLVKLGIRNHTKIYNSDAALFIGKELFPHLKGKELATAVSKLDTKEYLEAADTIHQKLLLDATYKSSLGDLSIELQKVWSDNLSASTVSEYAALMKKFNSKTYFGAKTQAYLDEVLEALMENPANRSWLKHCGMKGGSTLFVLTKALYATDKNGNKTELAYFFNDLSILQSVRLTRSLNAFELKILSDKNFVDRIHITLAK